MIVHRWIFRYFVLLSEFVRPVNEIVRDVGILSREELIENGNRIFRFSKVVLRSGVDAGNERAWKTDSS